MSIGEPLPRADGRAKVTGSAPYAADHHVDGLLHAVLVGAPRPSGTLKAVDTADAARAPGVVRTLTAADMPRFGEAPVPPAAISAYPLQDKVIRYEGEPIAIVLAETLEQAEHGARLVEARIEPAPFTPQGAGEVAPPDARSVLAKLAEFVKGDPAAAMRDAAHRLEAAYTQPPRHHNPMEPSATVAMWDGDRLTMYDANQHVYGVRFVIARVLGLQPEQVRVIARHTGGGFGCKGWIWPHQVLAAAAARIVGKPVKLVLTRAQMYATVGYQPHIRQRVALGATAEGRLTCVRHEVVNSTALSDDFVELATSASKSMYATPAMLLEQRVQRANVNMPTALRAPWEGPGLWALESAADELAHALRQDPFDFRLTNYADVDPGSGRPWSSNRLREAYQEGARLFGWRQRPRAPRRDGPWFLGTGMASCGMATFRFPAAARVRLNADGSAAVETGTQDIGAGTLTIFPQIAADVLGLPIDKVALSAGDTVLPEAGPSYGSSSTMGVGAAVLHAAQDVRGKLARLADLSPEEAELKSGRIGVRGAGAQGVLIGDAMRSAGVAELVGDGRFALPGNAQFNAEGEGTPHAIRVFGAVFVEVAVDPELGLLRLRRAVGSYSAGRIINPRTARAQMTGGIIWGWGMAAMEASHYEPRLGRWLSKNLAGVAIPVNADIPGDIRIHFVDEFDAHASPLGAKGIGELGATGVAAAVANAVFDATGVRVRDLPITPDKLVRAAQG